MIDKERFKIMILMLLVAKAESDFIDELMVSIKNLQDTVDKIDLAHVRMSEKVDKLQEANNKLVEKVDQLQKYIKPLNLENKGLEKLAIDPTISVQKGNLIAVIPEWGPNFRITFDLNVHSMYSSHSNGWANVLHFTASGKDCCSIGDRVPALWTNSKRNYLYFCSNVDHHGDYCRTTTAGTFRTNSWYKIEIKQRFEAYQWWYSVEVEGLGTVVNVVNTKPGKWTNVAVYASDPFYPPTNAVIRNLNYVSSSTFATLP